MGEIIDIQPYLDERRRKREELRAAVVVEREVELVHDVLEQMVAARVDGVCDTCGRRQAVAQVYRSDAVASGLGGMHQCQTCLRGELRHNRGADAGDRVEALLDHLLAEAEGLLRLDVEWDPVAERAVAVAGIDLD